MKDIDAQLEEMLLSVPNAPHASVPDGAGEEDNVEVSKWGEVPSFDFEVHAPPGGAPPAVPARADARGPHRCNAPPPYRSPYASPYRTPPHQKRSPTAAADVRGGGGRSRTTWTWARASRGWTSRRAPRSRGRASSSCRPPTPRSARPRRTCGCLGGSTCDFTLEGAPRGRARSRGCTARSRSSCSTRTRASTATPRPTCVAPAPPRPRAPAPPRPRAPAPPRPRAPAPPRPGAARLMARGSAGPTHCQRREPAGHGAGLSAPRRPGPAPARSAGGRAGLGRAPGR
jgi:hypothetical protein